MYTRDGMCMRAFSQNTCRLGIPTLDVAACILIVCVCMRHAAGRQAVLELDLMGRESSRLNPSDTYYEEN